MKTILFTVLTVVLMTGCTAKQYVKNSKGVGGALSNSGTPLGLVIGIPIYSSGWAVEKISGVDMDEKEDNKEEEIYE